MSQARRTLIFEASTTNRIDSAPAWFSSSFCAPPPAVKWISRAVHGATCCQPRGAEENFELRSGSPCFDESSEVVTCRAEPPMTGQVLSQVVNQVVSQVVSQVAREAVAARTAARAAAEAMESSWSVARGKSRRRKWSNGKGHRSKLGSGWRGRDGFSGSSRPAQPHASTLHDGVRVRLGCCTNQHRLSAGSPVPKVMLKLELQRWPRTSDACGPAP